MLEKTGGRGSFMSIAATRLKDGSLADKRAEKEQKDHLVNANRQIGSTTERVYNTAAYNDRNSTKNHDPHFSRNVHYGRSPRVD